MASLRFFWLSAILTLNGIIPIRGTSCRVGGKTIPECGFADWESWNCSICATQCEIKRKRGICCPSSAGRSNQTACLQICGKLTNNVEETGLCSLKCPNYTETTIVETTTRTPLATLLTTRPTSTSKTCVNIETLAKKKSDLQGDSRISNCMGQCTRTENKDDCIMDCMGDTFNNLCKLTSVGSMCGDTILGLTICRFKRNCAAKCNSLVTHGRSQQQSEIDQHQAAFNDEKQTTKSPNFDHKKKVYNIKLGKGLNNIFPTIYPRYNQGLSPKSPQENITINNNTQINNSTSFEENPKLHGIPKQFFAVENQQNKSEIFITKPKLELEGFNETSRKKLDERFDAASETISELKPAQTSTTKHETSSTFIETPIAGNFMMSAVHA